MGESVKNYLRKHHWGIVQGVSGVYCAWFATWERFHPSQAAIPQVPVSVGTSMTPTYSMPFWLWIGIVVLALSVAIPAIIGIFRKHKFPSKSDEVLTPLQRDAFRLAQELVPLGRWPGGSLAAFIANTILPDPKYNEWQQKVVSTYALDFAHRVKNIALRFGKEGLSEPGLEQYYTSIPNAKYLIEIQGRIVSLACRINGIQVEPRVSQ